MHRLRLLFGAGDLMATLDYRDLHVPSETAGDTVWFNGTNWVRVPKGTAGQLLQTNGAAIPTWITSGAGVTPPTGIGLWHNTVAGTTDAAAYRGTAAQFLVTNAGATDTAWVSASGDASIAAAGTITVSRLNGAAIPAAGALVTGNAPYVSGVSSLTYSALNLAGGSGWVVGALPAANQAAQAMAGDVGGTTAASTITALAVSKLAAGAAGTVLTGPGPAYTAALPLSGLASLGSLGGYTGQAFGWAAASVSVAGGANVTLTTTQAQNRNLTFTGAVSADIAVIIPAGTALVVGSEYVLTNATTSTTPTTAAWLQTFKAAVSGVGIWLPPNVPIKAIWTGTDFIYGDGSYAGGDIVFSISLANSVGTSPVALFKAPANFHLVQAYVRTTTTPAGGTTTIGVGNVSSGAQILSQGTPSAAGTQAQGITVSQLGTDMAATDGYTHEYLTAQIFWFTQVQTVAACTVGSINVTLRGAVVPLWEALAAASFACIREAPLRRGHQRRRAG